MGAISFTATLQKRGPAAAVVLSDEQVAEVGQGAKRFPVKATVGAVNVNVFSVEAVHEDAVSSAVTANFASDAEYSDAHM